MVEDYIQDEELTELASLVLRKFDSAKEAKREVYDTMVECLKLSEGKPLTPAVANGPDIVMDVSSPILKNIVGLIRDIFVGSTEAPFTITPTPIAELPSNKTAELQDKVARELVAILASGGSADEITAFAESQKQLLIREEIQVAAKAAEKLDTIIRDQLVDAGWEDQFIAFIDHFILYPTAIMKAPAYKYKKMTKWQEGVLIAEHEIVATVETVSPFDIYPSPYCTSPEDAEYVIERRRLTSSELRNLKEVDDYDPDAIDAVFRENSEGVIIDYEGGAQAADKDRSSSETTDVYDALGYYGRIEGRLLKEYGVEIAEGREYSSFEAEIWLVGNYVIKCILNPDMLDRRPFFTASFEKVQGSFWGKSPAMQLRDNQKVATASVRALVRNMQFASGPIGEVDKKRIKDGKPPGELIPNTIRLVDSDGFDMNSGPAYRFHQVPSLAPELINIFERFANYGYELIGIPRIAFGSPEGMGTIGRTAGGVSVVMNQSTKSIKYALRLLEQGVIEPVVQTFIDNEMMASDDLDIQGDVKVYARGVSGILEKEANTDKLEWALQSVSSMAGIVGPDGQPIIPPMAIVRLLHSIFKAKGIPTEGIFPDFDKEDILSEIDNTPSTNSVVDLPNLEGRSPNAEQAIDAANGGF